MICATCSTDNLVGAKFCMECGATLEAGCPACGFVNLPAAKFCMQCGTRLAPAGSGAAPASTPAAAATSRATESAAERRVVSVLFADLVGFTVFAEGRDAEDVRETLTHYFDIAREVVERYGGTVEKFIGDAVMAVWGAPTSHEDDAERAVRAALELVDAVRGLGSGIEARAGVLTGEAAVTIGATNQGMVAGDLVNTASRLQSAAPSGSVLVGEATQRAAAAAIAFEPAGDQVLKGKQSPVPAWLALRVVAERGGRNRAAGLEPPFVGRADELRLLKDLFHATGREKRARVVSVIGPAGIGKSRLSWELSKYIDGLVETVYWHTGRSPAYGEGISFWALGEMVRERCGLVEADDEGTTRAKVAATVAEWIPDAEERDWIEPALLTLLGVESGIAADQLFGAWRTFFERVAAQGTVALVFEDAHFADNGLLDFIDHILDWSRGVPLYVVTLARPDLIERRPDWGAGKRNFVSLYLEPLPDEQMRELLAGLVPGLPESAVATIVGRADGMPLYAVETVRMLVAEGRLTEEAGVYVPHGDLTSLAVPETLTALIASRLDALDETDRRIVHDAAVLGQSFTLAALAAVADVPEKELEPRLAGLMRRELLGREMDPRSPERGQISFVQALIREVAYNTLSKRDRKKLHLAAARYFESLGNDEIAAALASHYLAAHANAAEGPESDALGGQARIALKAAAARASALGSFDGAITFLQQALEVTADPSEQVDLLAQAAYAARLLGRWGQAEQLLRQALELARKAGDRAAQARVTSELGLAISNARGPREAIELLEPAVSEFADADAEALAGIKLNLARARSVNNDPRGSLPLLEEVLEVAERHGWVSMIALGLVVKANILWSVGRRREAFGVVGVARNVAAEHGLTDAYLRAMDSTNAGLTETDLSASLEGYGESLALARKTGHRGRLLQAVGNYGYTAFLAGEWDAGLREMNPLLAEVMSPGDRLLMLNNALIILANRGESIDDGLAEMRRIGADMSGPWQIFLRDPEGNAALARGDLRQATTSFLELADDPAQAPEYLYRAARAPMWDGDAEGARALVARFNESVGYGPIRDARHATLSAGIAALEGRPAEALALYREAFQLWRSTHAVWDEALTGIDMATLLDPSEPEVAAAIVSARAILERLGAKPYLERLDAAASRTVSKPTARAATRSEVAVSD